MLECSRCGSERIVIYMSETSLLTKLSKEIHCNALGLVTLKETCRYFTDKILLRYNVDKGFKRNSIFADKFLACCNCVCL